LITITVQGYLTYKEPVGKRLVSLPVGSSLHDSLAFLRLDIGEPFSAQANNRSGELSEHIAVLLNGMHYRHLPDGLSTLLKDGDKIAIFPPLAGG
jgi:molybdopterin converting factor small subunit